MESRTRAIREALQAGKIAYYRERIALKEDVGYLIKTVIPSFKKNQDEGAREILEWFKNNGTDGTDGKLGSKQLAKKVLEIYAHNLPENASSSKTKECPQMPPVTLRAASNGSAPALQTPQLSEQHENKTPHVSNEPDKATHAIDEEKCESLWKQIEKTYTEQSDKKIDDSLFKKQMLPLLEQYRTQYEFCQKILNLCRKQGSDSVKLAAAKHLIETLAEKTWDGIEGIYREHATTEQDYQFFFKEVVPLLPKDREFCKKILTKCINHGSTLVSAHAKEYFDDSLTETNSAEAPANTAKVKIQPMKKMNAQECITWGIMKDLYKDMAERTTSDSIFLQEKVIPELQKKDPKMREEALFILNWFKDHGDDASKKTATQTLKVAGKKEKSKLEKGKKVDESKQTDFHNELVKDTLHWVKLRYSHSAEDAPSTNKLFFMQHIVPLLQRKDEDGAIDYYYIKIVLANFIEKGEEPLKSHARQYLGELFRVHPRQLLLTKTENSASEKPEKKDESVLSTPAPTLEPLPAPVDIAPVVIQNTTDINDNEAKPSTPTAQIETRTKEVVFKTAIDKEKDPKRVFKKTNQRSKINTIKDKTKTENREIEISAKKDKEKAENAEKTKIRELTRARNEQETLDEEKAKIADELDREATAKKEKAEREQADKARKKADKAQVKANRKAADKTKKARAEVSADARTEMAIAAEIAKTEETGVQTAFEPTLESESEFETELELQSIEETKAEAPPILAIEIQPTQEDLVETNPTECASPEFSSQDLSENNLTVAVDTCAIQTNSPQTTETLQETKSESIAPCIQPAVPPTSFRWDPNAKTFEFKFPCPYETLSIKKTSNDLLNFGKQLEALTGQDVFMTGSTGPFTYLNETNQEYENKKAKEENRKPRIIPPISCNDWDIRVFVKKGGLDTLYEKIKNCEWAKDVVDLEYFPLAQHPIIRFKLRRGGKLQEVDISAWQKKPDEPTLDHAVLRYLSESSDFAPFSVYTNLTKAPHEIRGSKKCIESLKKRQFNVVDRPFPGEIFNEDARRLLRYAMKKAVCNNFTDDGEFKDILRTYPPRDCFANQLQKAKSQKQISTFLETHLFSRYSIGDAICMLRACTLPRGCGSHNMFEALTGLDYRKIESTLWVLNDYNNSHPYTKKVAFFAFLLAHASMQICKQQMGREKLTEWFFYETTKRLDLRIDGHIYPLLPQRDEHYLIHVIDTIFTQNFYDGFLQITRIPPDLLPESEQEIQTRRAMSEVPPIFPVYYPAVPMYSPAALQTCNTYQSSEDKLDSVLQPQSHEVVNQNRDAITSAHYATTQQQTMFSRSRITPGSTNTTTVQSHPPMTGVKPLANRNKMRPAGSSPFQ